jgi:dTDP-4-amino-4,6-dideoxygalactose transaminase
MFGVRHVFLASSGRAGLSAALTAMRSLAPERDEVLIPAYTSFSVPSAVVNAGLRVSLYDLDPWTLAPEASSMEEAASSRTLCVVGCHLFGYPFDPAPVRDLCRRHGAFFLDDAAQAMGAILGGEAAGIMGDVGLFSLSRGKNVSAVDGGIVVTDRDDLAKALRSALPERGPGGAAAAARDLAFALALAILVHPRAYWVPAALPFLNIGASVFDPEFSVGGLSAFQAGLATAVLDRVEELNSGRRSLAVSLLERLGTVRGVRTIRPLPGAEPVFLRLPVLPSGGAWPGGEPPQRPALGIVRSYPLPVHRIPGIESHLAAMGKFPGASSLAAGLLTLPTHGWVREGDVADMLSHLARPGEASGDPGQGGNP